MVRSADSQGHNKSRVDDAERAEWLASLEDVLNRYDPEAAIELLDTLRAHGQKRGVSDGWGTESPYLNTISPDAEPRYPGDLRLERRLQSIIRWNAMAMVVRANREHEGIGGHISTYASAATLFEVGFNHFFRAPSDGTPGDVVFFQGHASPGVYARAFLEGRLDENALLHFRREIASEAGLSSYPHPWLMPDFWQVPSVSMGLSPLMAIYQARFLRYLHDRGVRDTSKIRVWCLLGDGECDEPESLGALALAAREGLDNLVFVVNCNLQRLDGPVRGNGKIIQELESIFRGARWNVIKVIWGSDWDPLLAKDDHGALARRMMQACDGDYQKYSVETGDFIRQNFFGRSQELRALVQHLSDEEIRTLRRGGHDRKKVYSAYHAAVRHRGGPTVILAKTVKGYGLGEAGEGRNVTHQQKKLNEEELREFRDRFGIPISDERLYQAPFYRPAADTPEMRYLRERRNALGGSFPRRREMAPPLDGPDDAVFAEFYEGSEDRPVATTMAFVRLLRRLLGDSQLGSRVVPIVPDEARTFGMDALFRRYGIYSHVGQRYQPVDQESLLHYREARSGQILEEGITEAGALSSFIAAGTAHSTLGIEMVPFFTFYSMFGFQRVGDLIWAAADARARGFLLGGTAGRTTLAGEGLQHQDGHSHLTATSVPNVVAYDPAYAYELAIIIKDGLRKMFGEQRALIYYITLYNETYPQPAKLEGCEEGVLRGMHPVSQQTGERGHVQLLGSGPILREAIRAQELLLDLFGVGSTAWSVTSYQELRREALEVERWNLLHAQDSPKRSFLEETLQGLEGPFVAASDYVKLVSEQIARWLPGRLISLGTDGFGRSDTRPQLRRFFEVDAEHIALAALRGLQLEGKCSASEVAEAITELGIDSKKTSPWAMEPARVRSA